ncbi:unnamed protein product [Paramecium sonneborni]|uniref:Kinesin motor domain-containing protein n=1 Tax=Paramecium sonneborni TaxID=65129 RepID=A0A8S1RV92_9CILI|nr:unnamed protein product [Paramecium sonneborni]
MNLRKTLLFQLKHYQKFQQERQKQRKFCNQQKVKALKTQKVQHIPYHNSTLTKLLKSSLTGNFKSLILLSINPGLSLYEQTQSTLRFGTSTKLVEQKIEQNVNFDASYSNNQQKLNQLIQKNKQNEKIILDQQIIIDSLKEQLQALHCSEILTNLKQSEVQLVSKPSVIQFNETYVSLLKKTQELNSYIKKWKRTHFQRRIVQNYIKDYKNLMNKFLLILILTKIWNGKLKNQNCKMKNMKDYLKMLCLKVKRKLQKKMQNNYNLKKKQYSYFKATSIYLYNRLSTLSNYENKSPQLKKPNLRGAKNFAENIQDQKNQQPIQIQEDYRSKSNENHSQQGSQQPDQSKLKNNIQSLADRLYSLSEKFQLNRDSRVSRKSTNMNRTDIIYETESEL